MSLIPFKKYRPYFTVPEMKHISGQLKSLHNPLSLSIIKYLDKYTSDIESGFREENYSPTPVPTLAQKLELHELDFPGQESTLRISSGITIIPDISILLDKHSVNSH